MACSCFYLAVKPLFTWFSETCIFKQMLCKENKKKNKKILSQTIAHKVWQYQMQSNNIQREASALWYYDKGGELHILSELYSVTSIWNWHNYMQHLSMNKMNDPKQSTYTFKLQHTILVINDTIICRLPYFSQFDSVCHKIAFSYWWEECLGTN